MSQIQIETLLERVPFFSGFSQSQLASLMAAGQVREIPAQTLVFSEGDPALELFLILEGQVKITGINPEKQTIELAHIGQGAFFGELALADGGLRSATAETESPCRFFVLSREQFVHELARSPQLLSEVIASISSKVRHANTQYFEEQLQKQAQLFALERQRHASLARMVTGMAHELNTPLGIVQTMATILIEEQPKVQHLDPELGNSLEEVCGLIMQHTQRMHQLVQSFKSLSPSEVYAQPETVDWEEFWQNFQSTYSQSSYRNLPLQITMTATAAGQPWIGYAEVLSDILMHLLMNIEVHAYPEIQGEVHFSLEITGGKDFLLKVVDQGAGIPPEHLSLIQDPFFTTRRVEGFTGLGLSIVSNLVSAILGGELQIASAGQGTSVQLYFPLSAPRLNKVEESHG